VWLCVPRIDSGALFAELVGGTEAGYFSIEPVSTGAPPRQTYAGDSFVLTTRWDGVTVTDYFDCTAGRPFQRAGRTDLVRVLEGSGRVVVRFAPRIDFGRVATRLNPREGGLEVDGGSDPVALCSPGVSWSISEDGPHQTAVAEIDLHGAPIALELRYGVASLKAGVPSEPERRRQTERFWSGWAGTLRLPNVLADQVRRSALALKALCQGPTGAIAAAATTSLPAPLGGVRNWDYRYCWPRDACLAGAALIRLGNTGTAMKLLDWMVGVVDSLESPERLRPIYTVSGGNLGSEAEIGQLAGYGRSRPVRVGNAAANQVQLDVFGPIVDMVALLSEAGAPVTPQYWRLVEAMVRAVAARWQEPDHGIWELRTLKRHHVHTKVMCWQAVSRAMVLAEHVLGRARPDWAALRDTIAAEVMELGWSTQIGAFTSAYGESTLDAATLLIGLTGLVPVTDPRFISTVEAVSRALRVGPTVYRYRYDDGLPGIEGGFNLCTGWMIESLCLIGRVDEAVDLLNRYAALAGPTGLLSEQFDPDTGLSLGNFPQAYSHLALINAAVRVAAARA
jgi:GH15 family glucan-1,4-alpha-glucosidase